MKKKIKKSEHIESVSSGTLFQSTPWSAFKIVPTVGIQDCFDLVEGEIVLYIETVTYLNHPLNIVLAKNGLCGVMGIPPKDLGKIIE